MKDLEYNVIRSWIWNPSCLVGWSISIPDFWLFINSFWSWTINWPVWSVHPAIRLRTWSGMRSNRTLDTHVYFVVIEMISWVIWTGMIRWRFISNERWCKMLRLNTIVGLKYAVIRLTTISDITVHITTSLWSYEIISWLYIRGVSRPWLSSITHILLYNSPQFFFWHRISADTPHWNVKKPRQELKPYSYS